MDVRTRFCDKNKITAIVLGTSACEIESTNEVILSESTRCHYPFLLRYTGTNIVTRWHQSLVLSRLMQGMRDICVGYLQFYSFVDSG